MMKKIVLAKKTLIIVLAALMVICGPIQVITSKVFARDFGAEIAAKEAEIASFQAEAARLASQADTLTAVLAALTNEKNQIQAQINVSQVKYDQLIAQIADTEKQIKNNQDGLGITIADLYVDDNITPVEMLFGSSNLSDYMDKQEYRNSVRNSINTKISEIKTLKSKLEIDKKDAENVLNDQKRQRDELASREAEQQNLIASTKGQEQAYQELSQASQAAKRQLEIEQQAALAKLLGGYTVSAGDPNKGGYPDEYSSIPYWAGPSDSGWYWEVEVPDKWGMFARQCVSYVAWKVHQSYLNRTSDRDMPYWGGIGNAYEWPDNAIAAGIPVSSTPSAHTVGAVKGDPYTHQGQHVVWVESVNSDGTINISQYNYCSKDCGNGGLGRGQYSEMYNVSPNKFPYYIDF
ncbi:MAG: CHAP domain-containing protein [Candidatus Saccharibacteria bacterium]